MKNEISAYLAKQDTVLEQIIHTIPYPQIISTNNVFHDLMSLVVEQQIHYRSAKRIFQKALERAKLEELNIENIGVFITEGLSTLKVSEKKHDSIAEVIDFFENNQIQWSEKSNAEIHKLLTGVTGIGKKSVDMILLYTLQRPDIFIANDYHLKMIMESLYEIPSNAKLNAQIKTISTQWAPYRSTAVRYLLDWKTYQKKRPV